MAKNTKKVNVKVAEKGAKKTSTSLKGVDKSILGISKSALKTTAALGGMFLGFQALKKGIDNTIGASIRQEQIFRKLQTSIEITGRSYASVKKEIDRTFSSLQDFTEFGDTDSAATLTTLIQLTGNFDTAMGALPLTLDLAATGLFDVNTAAKLMGQVMAGELSLLGRYFAEFKTSNPEFAKLKTNAEKAAFGLKTLNEKVGGTAARNVETTAGAWKQLTNELGDFGESLGDIATPLLLDTIKEINELLFGQSRRVRQVGDAFDFIAEQEKLFTKQQLEDLTFLSAQFEIFGTNNAEAIENFLFVFGKIQPEILEIIAGMKDLGVVGKKTATDLKTEFSTSMKLMEFSANRFSSTFSAVWANQLKEGKSFMKNIEEAFKQTLISMAAELAGKAAIFGIFNALSGGAFGLARGGLSKFLFGHDGGEVTSKGIKRFHSGGLASDEVPAILQEGEGVLSRQGVKNIGGQRAVRNINSGGDGGGGGIQNLTIIQYGGNAQGIEDMVNSSSFLDSINTAISEGRIFVG